MYFKNEYYFLSNMCQLSNPVTYNGYDFYSTEEAYQASKCASLEDFNKFLRNNEDGSLKSKSLFNGYSAKQKGKTVKLRDDWNDVKVGIMEDLVYQKFSKNHHLVEDYGDEGNSEISSFLISKNDLIETYSFAFDEITRI